MNRAEMSLTSDKNQEVPKIKLALEEKYKKEKEKAIDRHNAIKEKETTKLPNPTGWRMLILPFKAKTQTKGGIYLSDESIERSQVASTCGLVLAMGPHCYDKEKFPEGPWCKKGDWVIFARYAGSRILIDGGEVRLLNDDEVLATVKDPEDIFHQF
jgi:co-chaperonin GroES (HSP10)